MVYTYTTWHSGLGFGPNIKRIVNAGVSGMRIIAKGDFVGENLQRTLRDLRAAASSGDPEFEIILDIPANKPIVGRIDNVYSLTFNGMYRLVWNDIISEASDIPIQGEEIFFSKLIPGHVIQVADDKLNLEVLELDAPYVVCRALNDFSLTSFRSLSCEAWLKLYKVSKSSLSQLSDDLSSEGITSVAISFSENLADLDSVRSFTSGWAKPPEIMAKIESLAGIENCVELSKAADNIMIARGDLACAAGPKIGRAQMDIIEKTEGHPRKLIVATGVLENISFGKKPSVSEITELVFWKNLGVNKFLLSDLVTPEEQAMGATWVNRILLP